MAKDKPACIGGERTIGAAVFGEDFGTGGGRLSDPNVLNHTFRPSGVVFDDFHAVARSSALNAQFSRTASDIDADGNTNGRNLFINTANDKN